MPVALRNSIVIIAIAAVALGGTGCRSAENPAASPSAAATSSIDASAATSSGEASVPVTPLQEGEATKLEAELNAIEKELDSMDLPSDSDFKDIEGALE